MFFLSKKCWTWFGNGTANELSEIAHLRGAVQSGVHPSHSKRPNSENICLAPGVDQVCKEGICFQKLLLDFGQQVGKTFWKLRRYLVICFFFLARKIKVSFAACSRTYSDVNQILCKNGENLKYQLCHFCTKLPRLQMAIECNQKEFVAHPSVQHVCINTKIIFFKCDLTKSKQKLKYYI